MPYYFKEHSRGSSRTYRPSDDATLVNANLAISAEQHGDWPEYYRMQHEFLKAALDNNRVPMTARIRAHQTLKHLEDRARRAIHEEL